GRRIAAAQEITTIRRHGEIVDGIGMPDERLHLLAGLDVPLPNDAIVASGKQSPPIRRVGNRVRDTWHVKVAERLSASSLPNPDRSIIRSGDHIATVRR